MDTKIYSLIIAGYSLEDIADYFEISRLAISEKVSEIFAEKGIKSITIRSKIWN